jgi:GR25 family glycosyltransferase involved in LPS biosynthesis
MEASVIDTVSFAPPFGEFLGIVDPSVSLAASAAQEGVPVVVGTGAGECVWSTPIDKRRQRAPAEFDSLAERAVLEQQKLITIRVPPADGLKWTLVLLASSVKYLASFMSELKAIRANGVQWSVVLALPEGDDFSYYLENMIAVHEVHVVRFADEVMGRGLSRALALAQRLDSRFTLIVRDRIKLHGGSWMDAMRRFSRGGRGFFWVSSKDEDPPILEASASVLPPHLEVVGAGRWALKNSGALKLAEPEATLEGIARKLSSLAPPDATAVANLSDGLLRDLSPREPMLPSFAKRIVAAALATEVSMPAADGADKLPADPTCLTVNGFFERVVVINLERRRDRWAKTSARLSRAGIVAERISAVDGEERSATEAWREYCQRTLPTPVDEVLSPLQFFAGKHSELARATWREAKSGRKGIPTSGAFAYLSTMRNIIREFLEGNQAHLLILDDDVVLHRQFGLLFAAAIGGLPADWLILQLGSLQYHWKSKWISQANGFLYQTNGVAIGSHALGLSRKAALLLLNEITDPVLPFDIGALSATIQKYPTRCYVVTPNAVIQDLSLGSDINSSLSQSQDGLGDVIKRYRWIIRDYDF